MRPNYFIFIGYLKTGGGGGGREGVRANPEPPLDPPLNFSTKIYAVDTQNNRLKETAL